MLAMDIRLRVVISKLFDTAENESTKSIIMSLIQAQTTAQADMYIGP